MRAATESGATGPESIDFGRPRRIGNPASSDM